MRVSKLLIYALLDPRLSSDNLEAWRYIGKSSAGLYRTTQHRLPTNLLRDDVSNPPKAAWIRALQAEGTQYVVRILEELEEPVSPDDKLRCAEALAMAERRWIAQARAEGKPLFNRTSGGEHIVGPNLGIKRSAATRAKHSASVMGHVVTAETRAKISAGHKGRPVSQEQKDKISATLKGRKLSAEALSKLRNRIPWNRGTKGATASAETRAKMAASQKRRRAAEKLS